MVSNSLERIENAKKISEHIPELVIYEGDNNDVFNKYIRCFNIDNCFDGVVVLEDDILLCKGFYNKIMEVICKHRETVISFFEKPNSKKELKTSFNSGYDFMFNQCNYYPRWACDLFKDKQTIDRFKDWYINSGKKWIAPIDIYIANVLGENKIKYLMKVPFLVQHLPMKSMLGNRSTKRQTKYFIDDI